MSILYLDCGMGAAGDMLTAALMELLPDKDAFLSEINALGIPGVRVTCESAAKCGIIGTHVTVKIDGEEETEDMHDHHHDHDHDHEHDHEHHHDHEHDHDHEHEHEHHHDHEHDHDHDHEHDHEHAHHHSGMHDVEHIVNDLPVSDRVKNDVLAVYSLIAEAESHAHGVPVEQIHFHEVGTMDAIADVTAVCLLMEKLAPAKVVVSPVHVGSGHVKCAHGILPVPAPATAYILRDAPIYGGSIKGELCTPTGAALLKHFADSFGDMPVMRTQAIGYGMGRKDFEAANCVRAMLGDADGADTIIELNCNIDDMTAEAAGFALERIMAAGAHDAFTIPIGMKKSRPGFLLRAICDDAHKEEVVAAIFKHTTTLGVRESVCRRYILERSIETVHTALGDVRKKTASGYGVCREKYEYDDVARIAAENDISIAEVLDRIAK